MRGLEAIQTKAGHYHFIRREVWRLTQEAVHHTLEGGKACPVAHQGNPGVENQEADQAYREARKALEGAEVMVVPL